jgi:hypothetical protein
MSLTNPPAIVTQLSTQLAACASWVGGNGNHWYPEAGTSATVPFAVLDDQNASRRVYASDAPGLLSGTLVITIVDSAANRTLGQLEAFGRTILAELVAQVAGIAFKDGEVGLVDDYKKATEAGEGTAAQRSITMSIPYGLDA